MMKDKSLQILEKSLQILGKSLLKFVKSLQILKNKIQSNLQLTSH